MVIKILLPVGIFYLTVHLRDWPMQRLAWWCHITFQRNRNMRLREICGFMLFKDPDLLGCKCFCAYKAHSEVAGLMRYLEGKQSHNELRHHLGQAAFYFPQGNSHSLREVQACHVYTPYVKGLLAPVTSMRDWPCRQKEIVEVWGGMGPS